MLPLVWHLRKRPTALPFPALFHFVPKPAATWKTRSAKYLPAARLASFALLIIALAQPTLHPETLRTITEGLAIQIVLDRSASMSTADLNYDGALISRLEAVKRVSHDFIFGAGGLQGRPNDMLGIICFAADPITLSPLTLSHETLKTAINNLEVAQTLDEDGTAIGDALALAAARLHVSVGASKQHIKGKVIVLITDGENNMGQRTPEQAAILAKEWGIKLYAITIRPDSFDPKRDQQIEFAMSGLATSTGGLARTVKDGSSLRAIH